MARVVSGIVETALKIGSLHSRAFSWGGLRRCVVAGVCGMPAGQGTLCSMTWHFVVRKAEQSTDRGGCRGLGRAGQETTLGLAWITSLMVPPRTGFDMAWMIHISSEQWHRKNQVSIWFFFLQALPAIQWPGTRGVVKGSHSLPTSSAQLCFHCRTITHLREFCCSVACKTLEMEQNLMQNGLCSSRPFVPAAALEDAEPVLLCQIPHFRSATAPCRTLEMEHFMQNGRFFDKPPSGDSAGLRVGLMMLDMGEHAIGLKSPEHLYQVQAHSPPPPPPLCSVRPPFTHTPHPHAACLAPTASLTTLPPSPASDVQPLVPYLEERARFFPPLPNAALITPSYFDAPAAFTAPILPDCSLCPHGPPYSLCASCGDRMRELPNVTIVFCGPVKVDELYEHDRSGTKHAMQLYKALVRRTLPRFNGYECQELSGCFMLASTALPMHCSGAPPSRSAHRHRLQIPSTCTHTTACAAVHTVVAPVGGPAHPATLTCAGTSYLAAAAGPAHPAVGPAIPQDQYAGVEVNNEARSLPVACVCGWASARGSLSGWCPTVPPEGLTTSGRWSTVLPAYALLPHRAGRSWGLQTRCEGEQGPATDQEPSPVALTMAPLGVHEGCGWTD